MAGRPLATLGVLSPGATRLLEQHGFRTLSDVRESTAAELAERTGLEEAEASRLYASILEPMARKSDLAALGTTAAALHVSERRRKPVISFVKSLDRLLGGGIAPAAITEFCGVPGIGKTQFAMQIAVNATIPAALGGVDGEAVVIDTEGSFVPERVEQMAAALHEHLQRILRRRAGGETGPAAPVEVETETMLRKIHIVRCHDALEQCAAIKALPSILQARDGKVRVVIIDSMAFHFRHNSAAVSTAVNRALQNEQGGGGAKGPDLRGSGLSAATFGAKFADQAHRSRVLASITAELNQTAQRFDTAVVVVNQMTTKVGNSASDQQGGPGSRDASPAPATLVPALGAAWAHAATHRVLLRYRSDGQREAQLFKSASKKNGTALFRVGRQGVRDEAPRRGEAEEFGGAGLGSAMTRDENDPSAARRPNAVGMLPRHESGDREPRKRPNDALQASPAPGAGAAQDKRVCGQERA